MIQENLIVGFIQSLLILLIAFIFVYKYSDIRTKTTHFVCPNCASRFKLSKLKFILAFKTGFLNERIVECPKCGYRGKMPIVDD